MTILTRSSVSGDKSIVRRVDHIIIRIDEAHYHGLYALFSQTLRLPTPWPVTEHPAFTSGGIFAGNVDLEILCVPSAETKKKTEPIPEPTEPFLPEDDEAAETVEHDYADPQPLELHDGNAQLYGIVFETWSEDYSRLAERSIPYIPAPYVLKQPGQKPQKLWTNVFLGHMLTTNRWMKVFFGIKKLIPDSLWLRTMARNSAGNASSARFLFDRVYEDGIVFLVKYNPGWRSIDVERRRSIADFSARRGGSLGLIGVREIVVGATNLTSASMRWHRLLRPSTELSATCWQVGDGPAVRLIAADRDGLHHLVCEVESLDYAHDLLEDLGLLGTVTHDHIAVDPAAFYGLDIRLVEAEETWI